MKTTKAVYPYPLKMRIIAFILSFLTVFYLLPTSIFAIGNDDADGATDAVSDTADGAELQYPEGKLYEVEELREENVKHFHLEDGTYVAAQYDTPVHTLDSNGNWQDIDNVLSSGSGVYATPDARIKFSKKTTGNGTLFTLKDGDYKLSMSLVGANKGVEGVVTNGTDYEDDTELNKMMNLEKLSSRVLYENVLDGVDIEYVAHSLNVKENIIVKEKSDTYSYTFELKLNKLEAELDEYGNVALVNDDGEVVYTIPAPVVYDSVYTYADSSLSAYTLAGKNGKYTLTVTVDSAWMNAEGRQFPVTVDPTVTFVSGGHHSTPSIIAITPKQNTIIEISDIPDLSELYSVNSVLFHMNYMGSAGHFLPRLTISDVQTGNVLDYTGSDSGVLYTWDITRCIMEMNENSETSHRLSIGYYDIMDVWGLNITVWLSLSANSLTEFNAPVFQTSYSYASGVEDYYTFISQDMNSAGVGAVNVATGKLTYSIDTLTTTDGLMPFTPTLVYNSDFADTPYRYERGGIQTAYAYYFTPFGFMLNMQESVIRDTYLYNDEYTDTYVLCDSDGTHHMFEDVGTGIYKDMDGLGLTMEVSSNEITITDRSKTVKTYVKTPSPPNGIDDAWHLCRIEDIAGNAIVFSFDSSYRPINVGIIPHTLSESIIMLVFTYDDNGRLLMVRNDTSGEAIFLLYYGQQSFNANHVSKILKAHVVDLESEADWDAFCEDYTDEELTNMQIDAEYDYFYESGKITRVSNSLTGKTVSYTYDNLGRVVSVTERKGTTDGQTVQLSYGTGYTEVRTSGKDDIIFTSDDIITHYTFDSKGRAVSCYSTNVDGTEIYGATSVKYETQENVKNSIKEEASISGESANYLLNGGFDTLVSSKAQYWYSSSDVNFYKTSYMDGNYSARLGTVESTDSTLRQYVHLDEGEYTLSLKYNSADATGKKLWLKVKDMSNGSVIAEKELSLEDADPIYYSTRGSMSFTIPSGGKSVSVEIFVDNISGTTSVEVDSVMLEKGLDVGDLNLVNMGHFEPSSLDSTGASTLSPGSLWLTDSGASATIATDSTFGNVAKLSNSLIKQTVYVADDITISQYGTSFFNTNTNHNYMVSGFAYASSQTGSGIFRLAVNVYYYQGVGVDEICVTHNCDILGESGVWQFAAATFDCRVPSNTIDYSCISRIEVVCEYTGQATDAYAYFDNVALTEVSTGSRYTYGSNGKITRAESPTYSEYYAYDSNDNVRLIANDEGELYLKEYNTLNLLYKEKYYTFTYGAANGTHFPYYFPDPEDDVTKTLVSVTTYEYNDQGLLSFVTTVSGDNSLRMTSSYTYNTSQGSKIFGTIASETDTLGNTTNYFYDTKNGRLLATTSGGYGTVYTYDGMGRITSALPADATVSPYEVIQNGEYVNYGYNSNGYLQTITTDSTVYTFRYNSFENTESVYAGSSEIANYEYNPNNGKLKKINYANGFSEEYVYNTLEMLAEIWYNHSNGTRQQIVEYVYTDDGQLHSAVDFLTGTTTVYEYDASDRLVGTAEYDTDELNTYFATMTGYDVYTGDVLYNSVHLEYLAGTVKKDATVRYNYEYNSDGSLDYTNTYLDVSAATLRTDYTYDAFKRVSGITYSSGSGFTRSESFTYKTSTSGNTSGRVNTFTSTVGGTSTVYTYTYDANGNISQIAVGDKVIRYKYDDLNQLTRVDDQARNLTWVYAYDNSGNILSRTRYIFTLEDEITGSGYQFYYAYEDSEWGDRLTSYMGRDITYDQIGNPLSYYNGKYLTFTWDGRQLMSATQTQDSTTNTYSFTYNSDGIRTSKTVNGVEHKYYLNGAQIVAEEWGNNLLIYIYDTTGAPMGMAYRTTSYAEGTFDIFWYEKNLSGDVVAIYDSTGTKLISYSYNAWGQRNKTYHNNGMSSPANYNPFMYRGYYYDTDLEMYYLNARYYDPTTARFISPDSTDVLTATPMGLTDKNLYAYCDNNPVMRVDGDGEFWNYVIGGAVGAAIGGIVAAANGGDTADIIIGVLSGALSGVVAASGLTWLAQAGISAAISAAGDVTNQIIDIAQSEGAIVDYSIERTIIESGLGFVTSAVGSGLGALTGKYITKTSQIADAAFDSYLGKTFSAGLRTEAGRSSSALLRQASKFLVKSQLYDNITRGASSVIGSIFSLWSIAR